MKQYRLIVKDSKIHGKGVFAGEDIPPRKRLIEYVGEWISDDEANRREVENEKNGATYIFWYSYYNSVDGAVGGNDSIYINHCCDPNCEPYKKNKKIYIRSIKNINKGEELFMDYAFSKHDKMEKCVCGSPKCRGVMNDI